MYRIRATTTEKVLAFAMVCSIWTQIRVASIVGISEILILFMAFFGKYNDSEDWEVYWKPQYQYTKMVIYVIPFGIAWNLLTVNRTPSMTHDLFAFLFVVIFVQKVMNRAKIYENIEGLLFWIVSFSAIVNIIYVFMYNAGIGFYMDDRFEGLSSDPNQLGELQLLLPWIVFYFYNILQDKRPAYSSLYRLICLVCIVSSIYVGILTDSDTYMLSSAIALIVYIIAETRKLVVTGQGNKLILFLVFIALIYMALNYRTIIRLFSDLYTIRAKEANQLNTRINVWKGGFQAFLHSPLVGNGPGAFSSAYGVAFGGAESHNTYIYILMDFGIIGFIPFLIVLINAGKQAFRSKSSEMVAAFIAFLVFNWFHSFHRMPLFWFYLYLFNAAGIVQQRKDPTVQLPEILNDENALYSR